MNSELTSSSAKEDKLKKGPRYDKAWIDVPFASAIFSGIQFENELIKDVIGRSLSPVSETMLVSLAKVCGKVNSSQSNT